jgi:hypothetical protein
VGCINGARGALSVARPRGFTIANGLLLQTVTSPQFPILKVPRVRSERLDGAPRVFAWLTENSDATVRAAPFVWGNGD